MSPRRPMMSSYTAEAAASFPPILDSVSLHSIVDMVLLARDTLRSQLPDLLLPTKSEYKTMPEMMETTSGLAERDSPTLESTLRYLYVRQL